MKKKYIQLGLAAVVLIALVAALLLLRSQPGPAAEAETPVTETIYVFGSAETETATPKQIDVHNEFGDMTIDNITPSDAPAAVSAELTIRGWENLSLDTYGLGQAASNAKAMQAKEIISENATAGELQTFGLDNPRARIEVHLQNGEKPVVLFGANAPGSEGVYVMPENSSTIYLIADNVAAPYFKPATAYVNKTITATDPEYKGFDTITLSGADYPETLVIERVPETTGDGTNITLYTHQFVSPDVKNLDSQRGLEPLSAVYGLLANDVVAVDDSAETLAKYGLDDPATVISVASGTPELTFTLRISKPDEAGEVHLIKDGSKVIYELSPSALPFLGKTLFDMMDRMVLLPNIQTVSKVVFTSPKQAYEFVLTQDEEGTLDVTANGVPLPDVVDDNGKAVTGGENFRKLYQTMIACRYEEEMPQTAANENPVADEAAVPQLIDPETGEVFLDQEDAADTSAEATAEADTTDAASAGSESEIAEASAPEASDAKFLASIEYVYNNGQTNDVLSFYEGPARKIEVRLNGEGGYYTQSIYYDRLLEDVDKVINGIAVKSYL